MTSSALRTVAKGPCRANIVATWASGENAAHASSTKTTSKPRSQASRAVVSTHAFVTTPPITNVEIPTLRSIASSPVELNAPYVVLLTTTSSS
jgi:hypothetical protein